MLCRTRKHATGHTRPLGTKMTNAEPHVQVLKTVRCTTAGATPDYSVGNRELAGAATSAYGHDYNAYDTADAASPAADERNEFRPLSKSPR